MLVAWIHEPARNLKHTRPDCESSPLCPVFYRLFTETSVFFLFLSTVPFILLTDYEEGVPHTECVVIEEALFSWGSFKGDSCSCWENECTCSVHTSLRCSIFFQPPFRLPCSVYTPRLSWVLCRLPLFLPSSWGLRESSWISHLKHSTPTPLRKE